MTVRHIAAKQDHDMIAADMRPCEMNLARGVEGDGVAGRVTHREMMRPRDRAGLRRRVRGRLAHLGHCDPSDDPGVALERLVNPLVDVRPVGASAIGAHGEAAGMETSIQRCEHMADDMRPHSNIPEAFETEVQTNKANRSAGPYRVAGTT